MTAEQIRHLAGVVSNASLVELGVIGYTEVEKKAGKSLLYRWLSLLSAKVWPFCFLSWPKRRNQRKMLKNDLAALILAGGVLIFALISWGYVVWTEKHRHS